MAKIFPGGSSVTRKFPASLGPTAATPLWTVAYEGDFSALPTGSALNTDAPVSVGGKSWAVKNGSNSAYVTEVKVYNGVGLKFTFDGSNSDSKLGPGEYTTPRIQVPVYGAGGLVPSLAIDDTLAFQVLLSSGGLDDDWQIYGMHLSDGGTGGVNWFENSTAYAAAVNGVSPYLVTEVQVGTGGQALTSLGSNSDPGMRELVWYAGSCGFVSSHNQTSAWADPLNSTGTMSGVLSSATNTEPAAAPTLNITIANATLCLHAFYANAAGGRTSYNCTFSKFRVLKRAK